MVNPAFTRFWFGQVVSLVGDAAFNTTLMLWIAAVLLEDNRYAPVVSSGMLLLVAVVAMLVAPLAGVLVDRWDKRRTMLRTDLIRAVLVGALALLAALPGIPAAVMVVAIGVVVGAATAAGGFFNLARIVFVGDIVDEARLGRASGLLQAATAGASIVGPSVAAPLLVTAGATWALALNAVSFLVSYVLVRSVRPERAPEGAAAEPPAAAGADPPAGLVREFTAALALFRRNRVLAALLVTTSLVMLGGGAATALDVYFFRENLHATPAMFGLAGAAFGVGALVGSAVGGVFGDRLGHARVFRAGALLAAGFFLVYSRLNAVGPAIAAIALFSVGLGAASTVAMPLTMRAVPRSHLARVVSVFGPVNQAANVLSLALAGALVGLMPQGFRTTLMGVGFGRVDLVFFGSAVLMLAGVAYAAVALRGADRVPAAAPEPAPAAVDTGSIAHRPTLDRSDSQV